MDKSQYWQELRLAALRAIELFPEWRDNQRKIQKSGNLQEWLTNSSEFSLDTRQAEIIKKILSEIYNF